MMKFTNASFVFVMTSVLTMTACGESDSQESEDSIVNTRPEPSPESVAAATALSARLENSEAVLVATQRGAASIDYTQPEASREAGFVVTTFRVQNQAENALAGFQVDEFWFDRDGNTVTGDRVRFREPILAGEVVEIELRVPRDPAMDRSNYEFTHQNGTIEPNLVEELPEPEVEEEEATEAEGEEATEAEPEA